MNFKWSDSLKTGLADVDKQHKELINRVNTLLEASREGKGKEEVDKTIDFLTDYVVTHFQTEEEYMEKYSYPDYEEHKRIHKDFVQNFKELIKKKDSLSFQVKLQVQVGEWLINHINGVDKKMARYLRDKIR